MRRASNSTALTAAVINTRVSSEEQERDGLSLAAQLADCRRYVAARGWVIAAEHQDVMSDTAPRTLAAGERQDLPHCASSCSLLDR